TVRSVHESFFFSSRRRHTRSKRDWSSDVCSSDLVGFGAQSIIGDFLSGFFILSERQFGVGDYVSFDGTSSATEGTVVALTLRATKVRTPSGEVVMIPNGSAGVVTNYSQEWSRAVVNFDVPVRSGDTLDEIQNTIEET